MEEASSPDLDHLATEVARRGLCDVRLLVDLQEVLRAHAHLALPALEHLLAKFASVSFGSADPDPGRPKKFF